jgi:hypothetical protein
MTSQLIVSNHRHSRSSSSIGGDSKPPSFGDKTMDKLHNDSMSIVEYDNVKVVFSYSNYTATVVHGMGAVRVTTVYPLNWVVNGTNVLDFMSKVRKYDLQARELQFKLGLPV